MQVSNKLIHTRHILGNTTIVTIVNKLLGFNTQINTLGTIKGLAQPLTNIAYRYSNKRKLTTLSNSNSYIAVRNIFFTYKGIRYNIYLNSIGSITKPFKAFVKFNCPSTNNFYSGTLAGGKWAWYVHNNSTGLNNVHTGAIPKVGIFYTC